MFIVILNMALICQVTGQKNEDYEKIDRMLILGDYEKVIDTCNQILARDSLNAAIWYKKGLANQNMLPDDKSFDCFLKALEIDPENNNYRFMVAKEYFARNKIMRARPLFTELATSDSMDWRYAYYLTGIYLRDGKYDEAINVYNRFYNLDSTNYVILDKLGFANLKKENYQTAIDFYNRSMAINKNNLNTIKNLSFLYTCVHKSDTAIQLLTRGIELDPDDPDLYIRRGSIYYSHVKKQALNDYLKILSLGDSSVLYIKRAGIGWYFSNNNEAAIKYLLNASKKDTTDYEILDFLAQSYHKLKDLKNTEYYYSKILKILDPVNFQFSGTYTILGYVYIEDKLYEEAIKNFLISQQYIRNPGLFWTIAYLYDEKLNNPSKAIYYYRQFLADHKNSGIIVTPDELDSMNKRIEYLEQQQKALN